MTDSLFRSGTLELPLAPLPAESLQTAWVDLGINRILIVVAVILFLAFLKSFARVTPHILQSLQRSRGCLNLEHSYSMASLRNICACVMILPFCLIADRFQFLHYLFGWSLPVWAGSPAVLCVLAAYVLIRQMVYFIFRPRRMDYDYSNALNKSLYTFFIVLSCLMLASLAAFLLPDVSTAVCRIILFAEIVVMFLFSLLRSIQFLSSFCNGFATFLYLCALEFVPVAAVGAACTFLKL